jgi:probable HAF family extracellular repeat protein
MKTIAATVLLIALVAAARAQPHYRITDLSTLGGDTSEANGINNRGQVIGHSSIANGTVHAFLYSGGKMQDLGTLGGDTSDALGINDHGQVVGVSDVVTVNGTTSHAFLYSGGKMRDLTPSGIYSVATGINNRGEIALWSVINPITNASHAFLYRGGQMQDLGTLGGDDSAAFGINDRGQVVGHSFTTDNATDHAFLYTGGQMEDLGALGPNSANSKSAALGINDRGQVVGYIFDFLQYEGFLYTGGKLEISHGVAGHFANDALAINNRGDAVGDVVNGIGASAGGLFYSDDQGQFIQELTLNSLLDLNSGWFLATGTGINNASQIVGSGVHNGLQRAFIMTPVR